MVYIKVGENKNNRKKYCYNYQHLLLLLEIEEANWITQQYDMNKHGLPVTGYDAVICLGNSFAHLIDYGDKKELIKLARCTYIYIRYKYSCITNYYYYIINMCYFFYFCYKVILNISYL